MPSPLKMKLPPLPTFKRPHDLVYACNDKPPAFALCGLALQHCATALALIAYVLASARIGGLDAESTRSMVTATILGMALATFLQSWGGRLGSGMLLIHMPDPLLVVISGMIAAEYGIGGLVLVGVVNGTVALGAGFIVPRLRAVLPPTVAGVVVCVAGLSLIPPALTHTSGLNAASGVDRIDVLIGGLTLLVIVALSIWGNHRAKLFALLAGLAAGVALAAFFGRLHGFDTLGATPVFGFPVPPAPKFGIDPGVLAAVAVLALMTQLDTFGCVVLMHKMNDADWRRPDMRMVGGGIRANGLGNLLGAWMGACPSAISSANIALTHISRSTSRWIGLLTGLLLAFIAFLPQVTLALTLIPTPVIGAVELYAAAYLIVSGIELIASRAMDARGIFMIGLSFVAGMGVIFLPGMAEAAPESVQFMAKNGIIVAGLTAIGLNLLFRLGTSQRASLELDGDGPQTQKIVEFVEAQGAAWAARRDAVRRAAQAAMEAAEALQAAGGNRRLVKIRGSFDEFNLDFELLHEGLPLTLQAKPGASPANLLDVDDDAFHLALDEALAGVSHTLLRRLADRLSSGTRSGHSFLRLHFDH
ncbi:solute carrier family 23 protein [Pollutimonas sp. M17]|uniref:solute carrier family 23 protein n=1 Tax=Pollutimonas sp. M17 TaxID=2962065 RepID=UPI0021F48E05|nr:solute carrier family 23 protein [Pollutimonas sp. M17]UYO93399.1 purine/pyrimidine permease [Pollutimonas sp. M17]